MEEPQQDYSGQYFTEINTKIRDLEESDFAINYSWSNGSGQEPSSSYPGPGDGRRSHLR